MAYVADELTPDLIRLQRTLLSWVLQLDFFMTHLLAHTTLFSYYHMYILLPYPLKRVKY